MIVIATSDKGGTGRSVSSGNLAYRLSTAGQSVAYLDFDFGAPTAGAIFEIGSAQRGVSGGAGLHSYLLGRNTTAAQIDVYAATDRVTLRKQRHRRGRLVLLPGDEGGGQLARADQHDAITRCAALLLELQHAFQTCIIDLSGGRSIAMEVVLRATALPQMRESRMRWIVFHRWTRQHIVATSGLVHGPHGLLESGAAYGHDPTKLLESIRYVRTLVPAANELGATTAASAVWIQEQNHGLKRLASTARLGASVVLGEIPFDSLLQWREQIILDADVAAGLAKGETVDAFQQLGRRLFDDATWETL
ncbi:SCO2523 family variant P-loop protein [Nocardia sp. bgisy118]|uniref:SCO2523 family variant P-loop protein n=1 Tax=Nocardia sp. bgisy118 TaxID=3413786 RepID=UPI003F4A4F9D